MKEVNRLRVVESYMDGTIDIGEAVSICEITQRSFYRLLARVRVKGPEGAVHGLRGRPCPTKTHDDIRTKVIELARTKYEGVNDTHFCEYLRNDEGIVIGRETLRGILRNDGIGPKRKVRRKQGRMRRERKEAFGMMLQIDASDHDWLEGRGPRLTLVGAIDDATGRAWVRFETAETTWGYMELMRGIAKSHGLPLSLYSDRHTIFHSPREQTIGEQLADIIPLTRFGRAMDELGITIIKAWSPQAKGRIERLWGTLQDRLVSSLRLAGARTLEDANLELGRFLPSFNRRFSVPPRETAPVFRQTPPAEELRRILSIRETRTVKKDHTISFEGRILQLPVSRKYPCMAGGIVEVNQYRNGNIEVRYRGEIVSRFNASHSLTQKTRATSTKRAA